VEGDPIAGSSALAHTRATTKCPFSPLTSPNITAKRARRRKFIVFQTGEKIHSDSKSNDWRKPIVEIQSAGSSDPDRYISLRKFITARPIFFKKRRGLLEAFGRTRYV
jgi:hypothetical protein